MPPLPAGWDSDCIYSTNEIELVDLPAADHALIAAWRIADREAMKANLQAAAAKATDTVNAYLAKNGMPSLEERDRAIAEAYGMQNYDPDTQANLFDVARALSKMEGGGEAWGFVVFKTWGYKDSEKATWTAYWNRWNEVMDATLREMGAVGDLKEGIAGALQWWLIDHTEMDGKSFTDVRDCFQDLVEDAENTIPLGLDLDFALLVDKVAADSLLDLEGQAFVWGVDANFDDEEETKGSKNDYPGYFKVSTDVLIPELWQDLEHESPTSFYRGKEKIYLGSNADMEEEMMAGCLKKS